MHMQCCGAQVSWRLHLAMYPGQRRLRLMHTPQAALLLRRSQRHLHLLQHLR